MCFCALFASLIAAGTFIVIPAGPVPIVLQNMMVLLAGLILGPIMGTTSVLLFLLAGILGLPVFAGGTGSIARLAGPTGGFLAGYLLTGFLSGLIAGIPQRGIRISALRLIIAITSGLLIVYIPGLFWLKYQGELTWNKTLAIGLIPFIPGDIIKGIAAFFIAIKLRKTAAELLNL